MRRISSQGGQVLIILLGVMFLGGGAASVIAFVQGQSPKEMKEAVKKVVSDDKRRDAVLTVIEAWEKGKKEQDKEFKKGQEQLVQIMKRHDAKREEADRVAAKLDESIRDLDRSFLEMRFRAKDQLTKEEWDAARKHFNK
jgi:uncharacterized membrane protein YgaE (UPF0421/DUF939 family)